MKKVVLAAAVASSLVAAAPATAQEAPVADPFTSSAFALLPLLAIGGAAAVTIVAVTADNSSDGTN
ncbi:hypothetical protein ACS3SW_12735 [Roseobacteraceae bacterium S113]